MRGKRYGKVYLIGSGPGDPGLMTLRGRQLLASADTVIYDALAGDAILGWIPQNARQINVGKRSGCHSKTQEEINRILVEEGKNGGTVVRLKGGDPFIFGRGGEEALVLRENHIPFEIVPGVTSAAAVPAYFGIPVTHRGLSASLHIITGHREKGAEAAVDYEALVRAGGTDVFLMGVAAAEAICRGLMDAGMPADTPAAFLQEGTTASQRMVLSTVEHLAEDARKAGICAPAILVVGEVCSLAPDCSWAEKRPLAGIRILVTRPKERSGRMTEILREDGAEVIELPAVELRKQEDTGRLTEALNRLSDYGWLVFTSPGGAELFLDEWLALKKDIRTLSGCRIAVIGPATAEVFQKRGILPDYMPDRFYAKELGEGIGGQAKPGERILILRALRGSVELTQALAAAGLEYEEIPLYDTQFPSGSALTERVRELLIQRKIDFITFTSGSTVKGFLKSVNPPKEALTGFAAVCIGEKTREAAERAGLTAIMSEIPSMNSMVECIRNQVGTERAE